ncbi:FG-GAP-like repeat-containing protein, partial [Saprospiraceae bacterium]|nr:FG-GAP-like repeat-containing protein [Saprospiraceae bacterium]
NTFSNVAALAGVLKSDWSWAAMFVDFNLDGYKDFYVTNGFRRYSRDNDFRKRMEKIRNENQGIVPLDKRADLYKLMPEIKLKNKLYVHDGDLHFNDESEAMSHPNIETYSYGAAHADFDNDGDQDLIINNIDQEALLLKNETVEKTSYNYLKIKLDEINSAKKIGAKITVKTGDVIQYQEYSFVRGYESTMEQSLNFGLGTATKVDEIKIVWPDNNVQILKDIATNQVLKIKYAKGSQYKVPNKNNAIFKELTAVSLGIDFIHKENPFDDFDKEILLPQRQTAFGPAMAVGDVNGDGLDDVYIGGAKNQPGTLYEQKSNGKFSEYAAQPWRAEAYSEDTDATFVDVNKDGHLDLIILSGGSGDFVGEEEKLLDRFYANDGKGNFFRIANVLPDIKMASNKIIVQNIDDDPAEELLIIGGAKPGKYPMHETSIVLDYQNNK